jgi:hypothetical protein
MRLLLAVLSLCQLIAFVACSSKELTRSKATDLTNLKADFASTTSLPLDTAAFDSMVKDKLWFQPGFGRQWQPSPEAKEYFTGVGVGFQLTKPVKREVIDVNGITDGPMAGTKIVLFTYAFKDVPAFVSRYIAAANKTIPGKAVLKLYDDGWRVQEIQYE